MARHPERAWITQVPLTARTTCQSWCRSTTDPSPSRGECSWFRGPNSLGAPGPATARDKRAAGDHAPQAGVLKEVHHSSWAAAAKDSQRAWRWTHQHVQMQRPTIDRIWRPKRAKVPDLRASTGHHQQGSDRPYRCLFVSSGSGGLFSRDCKRSTRYPLPAAVWRDGIALIVEVPDRTAASREFHHCPCRPPV